MEVEDTNKFGQSFPQSDGYLRVVVNRWNEHEIMASCGDAQSSEVMIIYDTTNEYLQGDYSYLYSILSVGTQLNILCPRNKGGELYPEVIIFEPDFLMDISSVASGFKEYGEASFGSLIYRLNINPPNRYTLLGDFVSQLLDEELHGWHNRPYKESIADFCNTNALNMAICNDLSSTFHSEAQRQKRNIHKAISEDLPKMARSFDPEKVVLEPSFICEKLGLQGRMDFLQTDFSILIEQKSGRGMYVPNERDYNYPHALTAHYIQLLLYQALLHYNYDIPNETIQPFLLYSRYTHPLLITSSAPRLLHRAFALRNKLVWREFMYEREGFNFLNSLTAEALNSNGLDNRLWHDYEKPSIEKVLQPLREATPEERAYHNTMLQFVQREYVLSKIGSRQKRNIGACGRWICSLEEKKEAGNIIDRLSITSDGMSVKCKMVDIYTSNFRVGDAVILFSYKKDETPDCRKSIVHRAIIESIDDAIIILQLRMPQNNLSLFATPQGYSWTIEHDFIDSSYANLFWGIHSFLSASFQKRSLYLFNRKPKVDGTKVLKGDYGSFNELQLRLKQAQELFLIIGPPGSAKTSFGMLYALKEELLEENSSVAVMAYTNRAVDEVCEKLSNEGIDFVRIGNKLSCSPKFRQHMLASCTSKLKHIEDIRNFLCQQKVVVGTIAAFNSHFSIFTLRSFSLAIIDEASQILESQIIGLISAKHNSVEAISKFVFIGDYKQLPPVVQQTTSQSAICDPLLNDLGLTNCHISLFERLFKQHQSDPSVTFTLNIQGRMHEDIARLSNELFYNNSLSCVPLPHQIAPSTTPRVQFIHVSSTDEVTSDTVNIAEAKVIAHLVENIESNLSIGIIVPYRNQISTIKQALIYTIPLHNRDITIDTVERFQGSQRDVIIYGFTVQKLYQLEFLTENSFFEKGKLIDRKLNVVITRAKSYLYLVGNSTLLSHNPIYLQLINNYLIN